MTESVPNGSTRELTPLLSAKQGAGGAAGGSILAALCDRMVVDGLPQRSDVIFVLAGRLERKVYGLEIYYQRFAPRLILSVGRFEVRKMDQLGFQHLRLRELAARKAPDQRHFFIDLASDSQRVIPAKIRRAGTFDELTALAAYLGPEVSQSLTVISTSIHLRRVRWCCMRISGLHQRTIRYVSVPEERGSFRRAGWWKRRSHWSYLAAEYWKLIAYSLLFRGKNPSHESDSVTRKT
jgi:hypothetical protein